MPPSGRRSQSKLREEYHHGDLRQALVDAALEDIAAHGAERVTLRGVARAAGVSHMAPYNHFADKAALLAAAAAVGFRQLGRAMEERMAAHPRGDPKRLQAAGIAYAVFAVDHPALFRLMFGPELADRRSHEELGQAAADAFRSLLGAIGDVGSESEASPAVADFAVIPWALVHGLAMLAVAGQLPGMDAQHIEVLARRATDVLYEGMAADFLSRTRAGGGPGR